MPIQLLIQQEPYIRPLNLAYQSYFNRFDSDIIDIETIQWTNAFNGSFNNLGPKEAPEPKQI